MDQSGRRTVPQETFLPLPAPTVSYRSLAGKHAAEQERLELAREKARGELSVEREEEEERLALARAQTDKWQVRKLARQDQEREEFRTQQQQASLKLTAEKVQKR